MKSKRLRTPKAKAGELKMVWGKLPHDDADMCYVWGEGVHHSDGNLLHAVLGSKRPPVARGDEWLPSLLDELKHRGYDLTTFKLSIRKKEQSA